jgi:hypothetical protein
MQFLYYQPQDFRTSLRGREVYVWDVFRKKWILLTPEEWVRQNLLRHLTVEKKYPASLIAVERLVRVGERNRRFDAVIFSAQGSPWMLIECKAAHEAVDEAALSQLLAYQSELKAPYLVLTNGEVLHCWHIQQGQALPCSSFPHFPTGLSPQSGG